MKAQAFVNYSEDIEYDEFIIKLNESAKFLEEGDDHPPAYKLIYGKSDWVFHTPHIRFRDYDMLGESEIKNRLADQCEKITLIIKSRK